MVHINFIFRRVKVQNEHDLKLVDKLWQYSRSTSNKNSMTSASGASFFVVVLQNFAMKSVIFAVFCCTLICLISIAIKKILSEFKAMNISEHNVIIVILKP